MNQQSLGSTLFVRKFIAIYLFVIMIRNTNFKYLDFSANLTVFVRLSLALFKFCNIIVCH